MTIKLTRRELLRLALPEIDYDNLQSGDLCLIANCNREHCVECPMYSDDYLDEETTIKIFNVN